MPGWCWTSAGVDGVMIGIVAGNAAAVGYGLVVAGRDAIGRLSAAELRTMLAFGLPLILAAARCGPSPSSTARC